jgi:hypothetical protein
MEIAVNTIYKWGYAKVLSEEIFCMVIHERVRLPCFREQKKKKAAHEE